MHPDQLYTMRALQNDDLLAEAARERRLREGRGRPPGGWRGLRGLLLAGAGGAGAVLLALVLAVPGGASAGGGARQLNRIFADEARYVPTVEEYLATMPANVAAGDALAVRRAPAGAAQPAGCRVATMLGMALCVPDAGAPPQSGGAMRLGGPR
ncbi:MAG TPA: hypothetical protein PKD53_30240 [Chloroflexaceae bacterium]|nr:hypothetical protein [Chloroflexaceae bacterium]